MLGFPTLALYSKTLALYSKYWTLLSENAITNQNSTLHDNVNPL